MAVTAHCDVIVLGLGGMGTAAAAHLAKRGLAVVGLEQDDVPSARGSSVGETRVIRKAYFEDPRYVPLLERAYVLWRELEKIASETLFVRTGCLTLGPPEHEAIRGVRESVALHQLPHRVLDAGEVRARFPALAPAAGDVGVLEDDAGYLHVEACTRAHARWAQALGADLRTRTQVVDVHIDDGDARVTLADGDEVHAPKIVVAAGAWLPAFPPLRAIAPALPLVVERQVQLWFPRPNGDLPCFVHFAFDRTYYAIPTDDAIKVCRHHGGEETTPDALDRTLRLDDEETVRDYLRAHLPSVTGRVLRSRVCMYTCTPDQHYVVGRLAARPEVVLLGGFSGHGYKAASVVGEIAAEIVADGASRFDLTMFDPGRFAARA
jgi:sarcosine oxidase